MEDQLNLNYMVQSLSIQLSEASIKIAERDDDKTEQRQEIESSKKELKDTQKEQIKEMDKDVEQGVIFSHKNRRAASLRLSSSRPAVVSALSAYSHYNIF